MKQTLGFLLFFLSFNFLQAQCLISKIPFSHGEEAHYHVKYNLGKIWVDAGRVKFKTTSETLRGKEVWYFYAYGNSIPRYDFLFKVRDRYESWAEKKTLNPIKFERDTYEGGHKVDNRYYFSYMKKRVYSFTNNSDKDYTIDTLALSPCTFDLMTAVYYARTIDFSKYKVNEKVPIRMIIDGEIYELYARYLGRQKVTLPQGKTYACLKFSAKLVEGTIFNEGEDLYAYVTDDDLHIPVLVEAKILVGSVKAILVKTKNLKHPLKTID